MVRCDATQPPPRLKGLGNASFALVSMLIVIGCEGGRDETPVAPGVVALVEGVPIHESDIELSSTQRARMEESRVPDEHLESWAVGIRKELLREKIWNILETQAVESVQVDLSQQELDAEFESFVTAYTAGDAFDSYEGFAEHADAVRRARIRYLENPAAANEIYTETLAPAGIGRNALEFDTTLIDAGALEGVQIPTTSEDLRTAFREIVERQAKRAKLFGVDREVTQAQRDAYLAQFRGLAQQLGPDYAYVVDNMVREERLNAARTRWLAQTLAVADIRIADSRFADMNLHPEEAP